jgi:hypothetical protein
MLTPVTVILFTALISAVAGLVTVWVKDRREYQRLVLEANGRLVDQLQEERSEIKGQLTSVTRKVDILLLERRYSEDYINTLRSHINEGKGPPPPGYPPELLRIASEGL